MNFVSKPGAGSGPLYLAPLDGLRFLAFLAVFVYHLPKFRESKALSLLNDYGWVGVELFFAISSFLFFHLLSAEHEKAGRISAWRFYARRMLRIYPLMMAFPIAMLAMYGSGNGLGIARIAALGLFLDNFVILFEDYNGSIPFSAHLWTLSFEFQIYLIIPFVFMAYKRYGRRAFLIGALAVFTYCFLARIAVFATGAKDSVIWVTPFLRPESVLTGMALFVIRPQWRWVYSAVGALVAGTLFLSIAAPWDSALGSALSYPLAALMCGGMIDTALRAPWASAALSTKAITGLGKISFGLYVYHLVSISLARQVLPKAVDYTLLFVVALAITVLISLVSYGGFERVIERHKRRFAVVEGRPVGEPALAV